MAAVSVGLPVYNGERYLEVAIRSVLAQSWTELELVICDNGSTDRTEAICRRFVAQDPRVRYHRNARNIGAAGNFCLTFELASGAYFRWLSVDDYIGPTWIEKCLALLEAHEDAVLACTKTVFVDEHGAELRPYDEVQALEQPRACDRFRAVLDQDSWCNAVYGLTRRETLARTALVGAFPASDKALLAELAMHGRFLEVSEPLFFRRIHPGAYSYGISSERDREFYTPKSSNRSAPMIRAWRHRIANARAVMRSPAGITDKIRMLEHVLRRAWWQYDELLREAGNLIRGPGRG
jgi:glycosyltransferase involved in cell wall biosynthesis